MKFNNIKIGIIAGAILLTGGGTVLAVQAMLPTRVDIQEKLYNSSNARVHQLANEIKIKEHNLAQLQKEADTAFCLLVDLKRADGLKINSKESVLRYNATCHQDNQAGAFQTNP